MVDTLIPTPAAIVVEKVPPFTLVTPLCARAVVALARAVPAVIAAASADAWAAAAAVAAPPAAKLAADAEREAEFATPKHVVAISVETPRVGAEKVVTPPTTDVDIVEMSDVTVIAPGAPFTDVTKPDPAAVSRLIVPGLGLVIVTVLPALISATTPVCAFRDVTPVAGGGYTVPLIVLTLVMAFVLKLTVPRAGKLHQFAAEKVLRLPPLIELTCRSLTPMILLLFALMVEIAGSSDQSESEERFAVVAMGMPLSSSSEPPAVVRVAPSSVIMLVLNDDIVPICDEM